MNNKKKSRIPDRIQKMFPKEFFPNKEATTQKEITSTADKNNQQVSRNKFFITREQSCIRILPKDINQTPLPLENIQYSSLGVNLSTVKKKHTADSTDGKKNTLVILEQLEGNNKLQVPKLNFKNLKQPPTGVSSRNIKSAQGTTTTRNHESKKKESKDTIVFQNRKHRRLEEVEKRATKEQPVNPYLEKQAKLLVKRSKPTNRRLKIEDTQYKKIKEKSEEKENPKEPRERLRVRYGKKLSEDAKNTIKKDLIAGLKEIIDRKKIKTPKITIGEVKDIIKQEKKRVDRHTVSSYMYKCEVIKKGVEKGDKNII